MIFGPPWRGGVYELIVVIRNLLCGFLWGSFSVLALNKKFLLEQVGPVFLLLCP